MQTGSTEQPGYRRFSISPMNFNCHDVYTSDPHTSLRREDAIEYVRQLHWPPGERCLFYGPYVALPAGIGIFTFRGQLDGLLVVHMVHGNGSAKIKTLTVNVFGAPICVVLPNAVSDFEIQAMKTPELKAMRLESVDVEVIPV